VLGGSCAVGVPGAPRSGATATEPAGAAPTASIARTVGSGRDPVVTPMTAQPPYRNTLCTRPHRRWRCAELRQGAICPAPLPGSAHGVIGSSLREAFGVRLLVGQRNARFAHSGISTERLCKRLRRQDPGAQECLDRFSTKYQFVGRFSHGNSLAQLSL